MISDHVLNLHFKIFDQSIAVLQYHVSFGCTAQQFSYAYICIFFLRFFSLIDFSDSFPSIIAKY